MFEIFRWQFAKIPAWNLGMRELLYAGEPNYIRSYLEAKVNASEAERARALERFPKIAEPGSPESVDEIYTRDGDRAVIQISGPLSMAGPDAWDLYLGYGGVSYLTIIAAVQRALDDPSLRETVFTANTPGGEVNGADITWQIITALAKAKKTRCQVSGMLASAGYYILCPAGEIKSTAPTDEIGSIGVIIAYWDFSAAYKDMGIVRVEVRSKNAPKKAQDGSTKAGRDVLQERVDAIERVFYQRISESRNVTPAYIAENFGQGALLLARDPDSTKPDAIRAGLIDGLIPRIGEFPLPAGADGSDEASESTTTTKSEITPPAVAGASQSQEVIQMTISEFLAQGPAAVAEIDKVKADAAAAAIAPINARIAKCSGILGAEAYATNTAIRKKAVECLEGKITTDALDGAVGMVDMLAEDKRQQTAAGEQGAQGDTKPQTPTGAAAEAAEVESLANIIAGKKEGK